MANRPPSGEELPQPTVEEWVLRELGYESALGSPIPRKIPGAKEGVLAEHFLDAYPEGSTKRGDTAIYIDAFQHMKPGDEDYERTRKHISFYIEHMFGPPPTA